MGARPLRVAKQKPRRIRPHTTAVQSKFAAWSTRKMPVDLLQKIRICRVELRCTMEEAVTACLQAGLPKLIEEAMRAREARLAGS